MLTDLYLETYFSLLKQDTYQWLFYSKKSEKKAAKKTNVTSLLTDYCSVTFFLLPDTTCVSTRVGTYSN
jgi:hypothetical protein